MTAGVKLSGCEALTLVGGGGGGAEERWRQALVIKADFPRPPPPAVPSLLKAKSSPHLRGGQEATAG